MNVTYSLLLGLLPGILIAQTCTGPTIPLTGKTCGPAQPLQLSCTLPSDTIARPANANAAQRSADIFSWQEFFALNWPVLAGKRGVPDSARPITAPGPRVWETWKESYEVFLPNGTPPAPWNAQPTTACGTGKLLMRRQKIEDTGIDETLQAAGAQQSPSPTLTDQKGRVVRYEIRMNQVMFDYIVKNKLYNGATQNDFGPVDLPNGSMLIKAAWREVASAAEESRFYVSDACVCDKGSDGQPTNCQKKRMALVGLHITQRTPGAPQWVWTTFEQRDNVAGPGAAAPFSFFNPTCVGCPSNQQTNAGTPNQLTRLLPIPSAEPDCNHPDQSVDNIQLLNSNVDAYLQKAGSIFARYQLIATQRPLQPVQERPTTAFRAAPELSANTTMESYVQTTSTCMGCHSTARTVNPNAFSSSHFTFQLNNAEPKPANTTVLDVPKHLPLTAQRGFEIVNRTYEMLPQYVEQAKLHCTSCHLNNGANSTAAWWVELSYAYPTRESLQARINLCFTNSLNGKQLCTPGKDCDTNGNMQSIIQYMDYLTQLYHEAKLPPPTPHGYPAIKQLIGNYCDGKATFTQKCAVCHQPDGQGRYNDGIYYRPALWGPESFNTKAGMFKFPSVLVQFISWNMPYGAGGLLTDQEAWDLEAYIDAHPRPGEKRPALPVCK